MRKKWDICNERDRNLIKQIPLSSTLVNDEWMWLPDDKGCFTVKSCYRLIQGEIEAPYAHFWRKIWKLKLTGKVIHFLWRVCSQCLPIVARLVTKQVQIDVSYHWCRMYQETEIHILFECDFAKQVWLQMGLQDVIQGTLPGENVFEFVRGIFDKCTSVQCGMMALACWSLWNRRNKWLWERVNVSTFGVRDSAMNMLAEWKQAQQQQVQVGMNVWSYGD